MFEEADKKDVKRIICIIAQILLAVMIVVLSHKLETAAIGFIFIPFGRFIIAVIRDEDLGDYIEPVGIAFAISELYLVGLMLFGYFG